VKTDLLIRGAGDFRIGQRSDNVLNTASILAELSRAKLEPTQAFAQRLVMMSTPDQLAAVWKDVPASSLDWVRVRDMPMTEGKERLFKALASVGVDRAAVESRLAGLVLSTEDRNSYLVYDYLGDPLKRGSTSFCNARVSDSGTGIEVTPFSSSDGLANLLKWTLRTKGARDIALNVPNSQFAEWLKASKAGFTTTLDSDTIFVSRAEQGPGVFAVARGTRLPDLDGRKVVAEDFSTAVGYTATKPGFTCQLKGAVNYIWGLDERKARPEEFGYQEAVVESFGSWTNKFKDEEAAKKYNEAPGFPSLWLRGIGHAPPRLGADRFSTAPRPVGHPPRPGPPPPLRRPATRPP
jgi:hypothetical protein